MKMLVKTLRLPSAPLGPMFALMSCDTPLITSPAGRQISERQKSRRPEQFRPPLKNGRLPFLGTVNGCAAWPWKLLRVDVVPKLSF